jgi:hypothetical protein
LLLGASAVVELCACASEDKDSANARRTALR